MPRAGNTKNVGRHYTEVKNYRTTVDGRLTKHQLGVYWELLQLIDRYEDESVITPTPRHYYLQKFIEEARLLLAEE